ncbi:MAG: CAP domain-containing protein [Polyangiaceae bacterium]
MAPRVLLAVFLPAFLVQAACSSSDDSSSTGTDGGNGADDQYAADRKLCVDTINQYRATIGVAALTEWSDGESCADGQAKSDSTTGKAHGAFATCSESAQDECPGWPGGDIAGSLKGCLQQMWNEGPGDDYPTHGHYTNMSNKGYTQAACGFFVTPDGSLWAVQNFR